MAFTIFAGHKRKAETPIKEDVIVSRPSGEKPSRDDSITKEGESPGVPLADIKPEDAQPGIIDVRLDSVDADAILKKYENMTTERFRFLLYSFQEFLIGQKISEMPLNRLNQLKASPGSKIIQIKEMTSLKNRNIWFIGDLHCDILGLELSLEYIENKDKETGKKSLIVFLGDLFDDDSYNCEIMLRIFELLTENTSENKPEICLLTGNHDEGLVHTGQGFSSLVEPSQFSALLNGQSEKHDLKSYLGFLTISLFKHTPRAIFFPDGLVAAHGGFPLSDLWNKIKKPEDLNTEPCLQDFVWTRAHMTLPIKRPYRGVMDSEFGYKDFEAFCGNAAELLKQPVNSMIRGHDHVEERYAIYQNSLLTINTLSRRLSREVFGAFERTPCIALYRAGQGRLPEVHRLQVPIEAIRKVYQTQHSEGMEIEGGVQPDNG